MKLWWQTAVLLLLLTQMGWSTPASAGEKGEVVCGHSGCGYRTSLTIGGGRNSPSVTGYCMSQRQFIRVKLDSWKEYRQPHFCPRGKELMIPIYGGEDVRGLPCPRCGRRTLRYERRLMFD
uniref:Uncharacterized protein n=1 Tax=Desulfobacca acetoxidans TaxID=60893 RepID=A0A7V4G7N6_9BACT